MVKYIIWAIVIYCLVRFIFNFLIPILRAAKQMKGQMKDFQERMGSQQFQSNVQEQQTPRQSQATRPAPEPKAGDYIDFEEIK